MQHRLQHMMQHAASVEERFALLAVAAPRAPSPAQPSLASAVRPKRLVVNAIHSSPSHRIASHRIASVAAWCTSVARDSAGLSGTHMRSVSRKVERKNSWTSSPYTRPSHADTRHSHADTRHSHADMRHTLSATTGTRRCAHVRLNGMSCSLSAWTFGGTSGSASVTQLCRSTSEKLPVCRNRKARQRTCDRTYYCCRHDSS
jgi:hypothetical protein